LLNGDSVKVYGAVETVVLVLVYGPLAKSAEVVA
tara:strand:- start:630 stop:731 length:102 start_codon:yes stop_codon:yes gene_type:complete